MAIVFIIIGMMGIISSIHDNQFIRNSTLVTGTITHIDVYRPKSSARSSPTYTAYVEYEYEGSFYENICAGHLQKDQEVGDSLSIYVNNDNPSRVLIAYSSRSNATIFTAAIFVAGILIGVLVLLKKKYQPNIEQAAIITSITRAITDTKNLIFSSKSERNL